MQKEKKMIQIIGEPAMLEQLAEEATELAKAALKLARIERNENPTPTTKGAAVLNLIEEYTDVVQCAEELGLLADHEQMKKKYDRFFARLNENRPHEEEECEDEESSHEEVEAMSKEMVNDMLDRIEVALQNRRFVERNKDHLRTRPMGKRTIKCDTDEEKEEERNVTRNHDFVERNREYLTIRPLGKLTIKRAEEYPYPAGEWVFFE